MTDNKQSRPTNGKVIRFGYLLLALLFLVGAMYKLFLPVTPSWADVTYISVGAIVGIVVLVFTKWSDAKRPRKEDKS